MTAYTLAPCLDTPLEAARALASSFAGCVYVLVPGHESIVPVAIEQVVSRLTELEVVLGPLARPVLESVRFRLQEAMAARDRGDLPRAFERISAAMDELAGLAEKLDPQEATLMRMVTEQFRAALLRGRESEAKQYADVMFKRSGARERTKK